MWNSFLCLFGFFLLPSKKEELPAVGIKRDNYGGEREEKRAKGLVLCIREDRDKSLEIERERV